MAKHILGLEVIETTNTGIFRIDDTSIYDPLLPVNCPNIQILVPGYSTPCSIDPLAPNFRLILNACTIGITDAGNCSESLPVLPDGPYHLRYSVSPNTQAYVEYDYMRTTKALKRYYKLLCGVNLKCCLPDKETEYQLKELDIIYNFILSAKVTVEECHIIDDGVNQLRYANHLMDKLASRKPFC
jgi:hypothetical protein